MGVLPYMALLQFHLSVNTAISHGILAHEGGRVLVIADEILFFLYIPLCLTAIANAAIKYTGFHLWRFFAFLLFAKGGEIYIDAIMGKWPL